MPIATSILDVVEAIKKQITDKAVGMSGTASPQAQEPPQQLTPEPPPDVDYTAGMQRPELTKLASNMEFKATPSRATAMLVALGNILQDKRNVEAAKQAAQQSDYDARFKDALDLTKARKGMQMKREFSEADPDVLLDRQLKKSKEARESEMFPLDKQYKQGQINKLFKKTSGDGSSGSGVAATAANALSLLNPEDLKFYRSLQTKGARDRFLTERLNPDNIKKKRQEVGLQIDNLRKSLLDLELKKRETSDPKLLQKLDNDLAAQNQMLVKREKDMALLDTFMEGMGTAEDYTTIKNKYTDNPSVTPTAMPQPQAPPTQGGIEFTGEVDPIKGRRVRDKATGKMGWMK